MALDQNKNPLEDQNAIENINTHLTSAGEHLANNKKIIYWVLGIIVVCAAGIGSYFYFYRTPRQNNSWADYDKALLKEMRGELTDSASAAAYAKIGEKYSGTNAADVAKITAASKYYDQKKYDQAIKCLEGLTVSEPVMDAQIKVLLGDCYTNKGAASYGKALEAYQAAVKKADSNPQIVPVVLIKEANIYDAQKNYAKALECYEQIKTGYPKFNAGSLGIDGYIAREKARLGK